MYTLGHTCSLDLTTPLTDQRPHAEATNRIDVSGPTRPIVGLSLPPPLHDNLPSPSRTRASVHFDPVVDAGLISSAPREPATTRTVVPSHCTFVPKAYTNGATGQTYVRNDQGELVLRSSRRLEKARDPGTLTQQQPDRSAGRARSASPRRSVPTPSRPDGQGGPPHLRLPALQHTVAPATGFSLPPIAPLMTKPHSHTTLMCQTYQHQPPPNFSSHQSLHHQPPHNPASYPISYHQQAVHPQQALYPPVVTQHSQPPLTQHAHTNLHYPASQPPPHDLDTQVACTGKRKATLADPRKAVVGSLLNPFRSRTGGCNPKYAHELRHNNWTRWTPIGGFAPRFNTDGLSEALSSGDALLLESGSGSVSLNARGFNEIPIEDTDRSDFTGITTNLPRAIREHLIPFGEVDVGSDHALAIADMIQDLFRMIMDREDFHNCFEIYREYVWRVLRHWHTFPKDNIHIDVFHTGFYQQILHAHLAQETTRRSQTTQSGNSASTTNQAPNQNQQFRNAKSSRGSHSDNYRKSDQSKTKTTGDETNVCYKCGEPHHHTKHKASSSDYLIQKGRNWCDPEGHCYCIGFNGLSRCSYGKDCKYEHKCGRCGSSEHNSQSHRK